MGDRLIQMPLLHQGHAEIILRIRVFGLDFKGFGVMDDRLIRTAIQLKIQTQDVMGKRIVRGGVQIVVP